LNGREKGLAGTDLGSGSRDFGARINSQHGIIELLIATVFPFAKKVVYGLLDIATGPIFFELPGGGWGRGKALGVALQGPCPILSDKMLYLRSIG